MPIVDRFYTLPTLRFSNFIRVLLFVDTTVCCVLWLTGGYTQYLEDNVVHFQLLTSVFDLAALSFCRLCVMFLIYTVMEKTSVAMMSYHQYDTTLQSNNIVKLISLHIGLIIFALSCFVLSVVKGGLILNSLLNDDTYKTMHATYNALVIASVCFTLLELPFAFLARKFIRKIPLIRVQHLINELGQEVTEEGDPVEKKVNIKRLIGLLKPETGILILAMISLVGNCAISMVTPLYFGRVVDNAIQSTLDQLNQTVLFLFLLNVGAAGLAFFRGWFFTLAGYRLVSRLRSDLFTAIMKQEVAFFDENRTGDLNSRLSSDTQVVQTGLTVNISMLLRNVANVIGSLVFMLTLSARLTGVLLSSVPVVAIGAMQYGKYLQKQRKKFQDALGDAGNISEECISNIRTVRSFSCEYKSMSQYNAQIKNTLSFGKKISIVYGLFQGLVGTVAQGAVVLVLWYGGRLVYNNTHSLPHGITVGVLTSFMLYTIQIAIAFATVSSVYGEIMQAVGASERIFKILDKQPLIPIEGGLISPSLVGNLEFIDVCFSYPTRPDTPVLNGVSFTVSQGQVVALVGLSGGGKSTIVSLIERFYEPDSGDIKLGGYDLKILDPRYFRTRVALVSQEPVLFGCSIAENIKYASLATNEQVQDAAKLANAHDFISSFEDGYKTIVGERGVRLSGGQKQRIAIARALIMNPVFLLLDEATSALDAESEYLVQEAIDRAMHGRTVLVIAHRLSTVRNADEVVVIDKGTIVERGSHDDLIAANGVYKKLVLRQMMAAKKEDGEIDHHSDDNMSTEA